MTEETKAKVVKRSSKHLWKCNDCGIWREFGVWYAAHVHLTVGYNCDCGAQYTMHDYVVEQTRHGIPSKTKGAKISTSQHSAKRDQKVFAPATGRLALAQRSTKKGASSRT